MTPMLSSLINHCHDSAGDYSLLKCMEFECNWFVCFVVCNEELFSITFLVLSLYFDWPHGCSGCMGRNWYKYISNFINIPTRVCSFLCCPSARGACNLIVVLKCLCCVFINCDKASHATHATTPSFCST